jgi:cytosine deaminase
VTQHFQPRSEIEMDGPLGDKHFLQAAILEAKKGLKEGMDLTGTPGIPIGGILVIDGAIVGRGHNRRIQSGSAILHGEMDCLENAGRLRPEDYRKATLYTTLSPCDMCSGAILLYKIPRVVIGENQTFRGPEAYLRSRGVKLTVVQSEECMDLLQQFIQQYPEVWGEDIGETEVANCSMH